MRAGSLIVLLCACGSPPDSERAPVVNDPVALRQVSRTLTQLLPVPEFAGRDLFVEWEEHPARIMNAPELITNPNFAAVFRCNDPPEIIVRTDNWCTNGISHEVVHWALGCEVVRRNEETGANPHDRWTERGFTGAYIAANSQCEREVLQSPP